MNQINGGRWDRLLRGLFDVQEQTVSPVVGPEVMPTMEVQPSAPEHAFLRSEYLSAAAIIVPAVAGNFGYTELATQTGSIATFTSIRVLGPAAVTRYRIGWSAGVAGNPAPSAFRDSRRGTTTGAPLSKVTVFTGANAALFGGSFVFLKHLVDGESIYREPIVVANGSRIFIQCETANLAFNAMVAWSERPLSPSEL